jgi:hypothetical protein
MNKAFEIFSKLSEIMPILIIVGNHDKKEIMIKYINKKYISIMENVKKFYVYALCKGYKKGKFLYDEFAFDYEPFYIGKGHNNRIFRSKESGRGLKLNILNKHKKMNCSVVTVLLYENMNEEIAFAYEKHAIKTIGKVIDDNGPLANITDGGEGRYGEQKEKFKKVCAFDTNGKFIKEYDAIKYCAIDTKVPQRNISMCCMHDRYTAGNYIFRYSTEFVIIPESINVDFLNNRMHKGNRERNVIQYDNNMNEINRYESIKKAAEATGCLKSKIVAVCKNYAKSSKGFIWRYNEN